MLVQEVAKIARRRMSGREGQEHDWSVSPIVSDSAPDFRRSGGDLGPSPGCSDRLLLTRAQRRASSDGGRVDRWLLDHRAGSPVELFLDLMDLSPVPVLHDADEVVTCTEPVVHEGEPNQQTRQASRPP